MVSYRARLATGRTTGWQGGVDVRVLMKKILVVSSK